MVTPSSRHQIIRLWFSKNSGVMMIGHIEEYSEAMHVKMLLEMLESDHPCLEQECPAFLFGKKYCYPFHKIGCHAICRFFIDMDDIEDGCPCYALGPEEAIKRTWIAIEEKYPEMLEEE